MKLVSNDKLSFTEAQALEAWLQAQVEPQVRYVFDRLEALKRKHGEGGVEQFESAEVLYAMNALYRKLYSWMQDDSRKRGLAA
jgi:hypothetical protein